MISALRWLVGFLFSLLIAPLELAIRADMRATDRAEHRRADLALADEEKRLLAEDDPGVDVDDLRYS